MTAVDVLVLVVLAVALVTLLTAAVLVESGDH